KSPALNAARNSSSTSVSTWSTEGLLVANPPSSEAVPLVGTRRRSSPRADGRCECLHQHNRAAIPDRFCQGRCSAPGKFGARPPPGAKSVVPRSDERGPGVLGQPPDQVPDSVVLQAA